MIFISPVFVFVFLPVILALYILVCPTRKTVVKNLALLFCSLVFYSWGGMRYTVLLIISTVANYAFDRLLEGEEHRKMVLVLSVVYNVDTLLVFKYFNFFMDTMASIVQALHVDWSVAAPMITLPTGTSFFTFQIMSYVFDVYLRKVETQKNILDLALYIMLSPQLIAGPIVRYIDVNQETKERHTDGIMIHDGTPRLITGLNRKIFLANGMGYTADAVFAKVNEVNTSYAWLGAICYALQIYTDFSPYPDMAIGLGKLSGSYFLENLNYPYILSSIREFWGRWHTSLSSWFRDHVYTPLGGSQGGARKAYRNLLIVLMLTGFWHGVSWTFVTWELYHGFFLVMKRGRFGWWLERILGIFKRAYMLAVVLVGWVFFRCETIGEAPTYLKVMFSSQLGHYNVLDILERMDREFWFLLLLSVIGSLLFLLKLKEKAGDSQAVRLAADIGLVVLFVRAASYMVGADFNPFIYFRF